MGPDEVHFHPWIPELGAQACDPLLALSCLFPYPDPQGAPDSCIGYLWAWWSYFLPNLLRVWTSHFKCWWVRFNNPGEKLFKQGNQQFNKTISKQANSVLFRTNMVEGNQLTVSSFYSNILINDFFWTHSDLVHLFMVLLSQVLLYLPLRKKLRSHFLLDLLITLCRNTTVNVAIISWITCHVV